MSRVAVQAVCRGLYQHEFYLSKGKAIEKVSALSKYKEEQENPKPNKGKKELPDKHLHQINNIFHMNMFYLHQKPLTITNKV